MKCKYVTLGFTLAGILLGWFARDLARLQYSEYRNGNKPAPTHHEQVSTSRGPFKATMEDIGIRFAKLRQGMGYDDVSRILECRGGFGGGSNGRCHHSFGGPGFGVTCFFEYPENYDWSAPTKDAGKLISWELAVQPISTEAEQAGAEQPATRNPPRVEV